MPFSTPDLPPTAPPGLHYLLGPPDPVFDSWTALLIEFVGRLLGL